MPTTELVWMIDKDHINTLDTDTSRVNYGQRMIDAEYTNIAYNNMRANITMSDNCSVTEIPADQKIRWKAYDDDDVLYYEGHIRAESLLESGSGDDDIDYGYMVDKFVAADAGAVHVYWNVADIAKHNPEMAKSHIKSSKDGWIEIYE